MGNVVANSAKGRVAELYRRVDIGDPAGATLYVSVWSGTVTDAEAQDCDTYADVITAGGTKLTTNGWTQKELTGTDLGAYDALVDDANNWLDLDIPDQTWTSVTSGTSTRLTIGYGATSGATDANITLLTCHDFAVTPDGSDVTAVINTEGFYRAS